MPCRQIPFSTSNFHYTNNNYHHSLLRKPILNFKTQPNSIKIKQIVIIKIKKTKKYKIVIVKKIYIKL